MDRRTFLATSVAALGLAGCTSDSPVPPAPTTPMLPTGPNDPDSTLRATVGRSEAELIVAYRAAISTWPELAVDLEPFLAHHAQHLDRVLPGVDPQALVTPTAGPLEGPGTSAPAAATAPGDSGTAASGSRPSAAAPQPPGSTLSRLAAAERRAHTARVTACDGAVSPGLARDLCLIGASEAQHAAALDALAEEVAER